MLDEMQFPHLRITGANVVQIWQSRDEHLGELDAMTDKLRSEGWLETTTADLCAVQHGAEKVHLTMTQTRWNRKGEAYTTFKTLWIFTRHNGKWGVRFRSSYQLGLSETQSAPVDRATDCTQT